MDYAVHTMPSYQHLQGSPKRAHEGSQSKGHLAGGKAINDTPMAPSSKGPGGMDM